MGALLVAAARVDGLGLPVGDLGHGEAPGVLLVGVLDDDAEGLHEPVGREYVAARAERDDAARQQQHLVVLDGLGDVVGGGDDGRPPPQLVGEGLQVAARGRQRRCRRWARRAR